LRGKGNSPPSFLKLSLYIVELLNLNIMAGHFSLSKFDEPKVFETINRLRQLIVLHGRFVHDFEKYKVTDEINSYEVMKLSKDYAFSESATSAYKVGKFSLESITDEHPSLTQNISLEVHIKETLNKIEIVNIFWVA